ncbi:PDZ domain-containing protein [Microbacterium sp. SYP-A9085]|uniref:YlbL family protein n=1 Tax=Microbacterium sp. SYP-A9085 TaxID=2664454 RepID=UPI001328C5C8|nr:PDZ domain-containing protein [Microbacterium sp. SYP-A9085]
MALFDENVTIAPAPPRPRRPGVTFGVWSLTVALVVLLALTFLPTAYVIQRPGPVFDTLGSAANADGRQVPLISVKDTPTYPAQGRLDLLTVQVVGNRERTPSWLELAAAWFDPSRAVLPIDAVFPQGQSSTQRDQESAEMMVDSQKEATAAALRHLGYAVTPLVTVYSLVTDSAAQGILRTGDVILEANGTAIADATALRSIVARAAGSPVSLLIRREGRREAVSVTPRQATVDGKTQWLIGVTLVTDFDFPIDVTIQLDNVGGPSAGMMFALGIIDTLTPGSLTGGRNVAGTGTIDAAGSVGPIGGIRQKLYGAKDAGARYFLAPRSNCDEVAGHVPAGLRVFAVTTLDDSLKALQTLDDGGDVDALPTCSGS